MKFSTILLVATASAIQLRQTDAALAQEEDFAEDGTLAQEESLSQADPAAATDNAYTSSAADATADPTPVVKATPDEISS